MRFIRTNIYKIKTKIIALCVIFGCVILIALLFIANRTFYSMGYSLIENKLLTDINYIEDTISDGDWNIKDGQLFKGETLIGDGTIEKAYIEPFKIMQEKTGTFSCVFIKCNENGLQWVGDKKNGYQQGHFMRVAGSNNSSTIGTYIDKKVADEIDIYDKYVGVSNVDGRQIYCVYNSIKDRKDEIIGCIVVGINTSQLQIEFNQYIRKMTLTTSFTCLVICLLMMFIITNWINSINKINEYLNKISEENIIPDKPLCIKANDEIKTIADNINTMIDNLKENEVIQEQIYVDELTNLPNRFGLKKYVKKILKKALVHDNYVGIEIIDVDYFKEFNDNYGHPAGDACLENIALSIKSIEVENKIFGARIGGDEFIIVYYGLTQKEIDEIQTKLKKEIKKRNIKHEFSKTSNIVTISEGCYVKKPKDSDTWDTIYEQADKVLYEVKRSGRGGKKVVDGNKEN